MIPYPTGVEALLQLLVLHWVSHHRGRRTYLSVALRLPLLLLLLLELGLVGAGLGVRVLLELARALGR